MHVDRRTVMASSLAALGRTALTDRTVAAPSAANIRRIAVEEHFSFPPQMDRLAALADSTWGELDLALWRSFADPRAAARSRLHAALLDVGAGRLQDMDDNGVAMQVLSLTSPGVQMFGADTAGRVAREANDYLAAAVGRHPQRFAGLASYAPQDPKAAVKEMERAIEHLKLNGFIVNSHLRGEYYDDPKFWPIFEAAESMGRAIYLHPRCPSDRMADPFRDYGLASGMAGFYMETALHATRLMLGGVFDRFPDLKIVLGHMGEGLPYWMYRIDYIYNAFHPPGSPRRLKLTPGEYLKRNFAITTSGVNDPDVLDYVIKKLGPGNIMFAIDHPYQDTPTAVAFMNAARVSDIDKHKIYHGNAERIFRLTA